MQVQASAGHARLVLIKVVAQAVAEHEDQIALRQHCKFRGNGVYQHPPTTAFIVFS